MLGRDENRTFTDKLFTAENKIFKINGEKNYIFPLVNLSETSCLMYL